MSEWAKPTANENLRNYAHCHEQSSLSVIQTFAGLISYLNSGKNMLKEYC